MVRVTVRCPADGVVEVTVRDLESVVVRSGSDVEATYRCPRCGSRVLVTSELPAGLVRWAACQACSAAAASETRPGAPQPRAAGAATSTARHQDAYMEYFRLELASTRYVDEMVALMRAGERRRLDRSRRERTSAKR